MVLASPARRSRRIVSQLALCAAPLLSALSTFYWIEQDGRLEYGLVGGTVVFLAAPFWFFAFIALCDLLQNAAPRLAAWGPLPLAYGAVGAAAFGLDAVFADAFALTHDARMQAWAAHPLIFNLILFWPGPIVPLGLLILGILLLRYRAVPLWSGLLLALSGIAFPVSRIARVESIAHAADLMILIPMVYIAFVAPRAPDQNALHPKTA